LRSILELIGINQTKNFQVKERHDSKAFVEGWLQVSRSKMKVRCRNEFGGCNM